MLQTIKARIEGVAPLIMHNGQTRDPMNAYSKAIKEISSKRKKTDEDYKEMADLEWEAGLYVNERHEIIVPGFNLEACIVEGAKKSKLGQQFKAGFFIEKDPVLEYDGPRGIEKMKKDDHFRLVAGVRIGQAAIMRTRPRFNKWSLEFELQYFDDVVNIGDIKKAIEDAGRLCGLCDWTPRFGRFVLTAF